MRKKIFAFLLLSALYAGAQEVPDWENPIVVGINKEPYHATLTLPSQKADCKKIISLNGKWRFQWSADPGKRPTDCYNRSLKKLEQLEKEKKVIVIRPDNTDGFSRLEKDKEKIKALYHDGYTKGLLFSDKVKEFYTK